MSYPASHKKDQGIIKLENEQLEWKSNSTSKSVTIPFTAVSSLKASPAQAAQQKIMVIAQFEGQDAPQNFQFAFPDRTSMDKVKGLIQQAVQSHRSETPAASVSGVASGIVSGAATQSPSPAPNAANTASTSATNGASSAPATVGLDSKSLLRNRKLQSDFLRENRDLMRAFRSTVIEGGLDDDKFWESRINLLRSYALSNSQQRGAYNVLGTIKPTNTSENKINVSLTREKIHDIFEQYPIVSLAYNDSVPSRMSEGEFWQRFFLSRLFRRLRGEMVSSTHLVDPILDIRYLDMYEKEDIGVFRKRPAGSLTDADLDTVNVPVYLDIEGNEASDSQRLGNTPDITMQPGRDKSTVSLIRSVNSLSQRMTYGSQWRQPVMITGDPQGDADEDIALEHQLQLGDLVTNIAEDTRMHLDIAKAKQQDTLVAGQDDISNQNVKLLSPTSAQYKEIYGFLHSEIDLRDAGSNSSELANAQNHVKDILRLRSKETDRSDERWQVESDAELLDQVQLCHATSIEFLRHFWTAFQSGDGTQAGALARLVENLKKSLGRIDAVVSKAPTPEHGEKARHSLIPLTNSINTALAKYQAAVESAATATALKSVK